MPIADYVHGGHFLPSRRPAAQLDSVGCSTSLRRCSARKIDDDARAAASTTLPPGPKCGDLNADDTPPSAVSARFAGLDVCDAHARAGVPATVCGTTLRSQVFTRRKCADYLCDESTVRRMYIAGGATLHVAAASSHAFNPSTDHDARRASTLPVSAAGAASPVSAALATSRVSAAAAIDLAPSNEGLAAPALFSCRVRHQGVYEVPSSRVESLLFRITPCCKYLRRIPWDLSIDEEPKRD